MPEIRIAAEPRAEFGKGPARRVRAAGRVPAVLYGHGKATRHLSLPGHELMLALKGGPNTLLQVDLDGESELALPRQVVRDPIKGFLRHLDLLVVARGEKVSVSVPVVVTGQAAPDTIVDLQLTALPVEAEATAIPQHFEVNVEGLTVGASITAGQVRLARSVTLAIDPGHLVVHVLAAPTAEELLAEVETAEEGAEAPATPGGEAAAEGAEPAEGAAAGGDESS